MFILAAAIWLCTLDDMLDSLDRITTASLKITQSATDIENSAIRIENTFPMTNTVKPEEEPQAFNTYKLSKRSTSMIKRGMTVAQEDEGCSGETDENGEYTINCPINEDFAYVEPRKAGDMRNSVTRNDAKVLLDLLVGKGAVSKEIGYGADTSGDGTISSLDVAYILSLADGKIQRLPVSESCDSDWVFFPRTGGTESWPSHVGGFCNRGKVILSLNDSPRDPVDFDAMVYGDVDLSWR